MKSRIGAALLALVVMAGGSILWHNRLSADFYPPDRSYVGPNLVASVVQWAIIALVAYLVYPPLRKAVDKWMKDHARHANAELHEKLDEAIKLSKHVIKHHPDIPNTDHNGKPLVEEHP